MTALPQLGASQDDAGRDVLLPMHLRLALDGTILHAGPTLEKVLGRCSQPGLSFFDAFEVRRPQAPLFLTDLADHGPFRLQVALLNNPRISMKGTAIAHADMREALVNLSFGISIVDAIREYDLTSSDFAHTDLAVEMLYLIEAKTAILDEWRSLNARLEEARVTAERQAYTDTLTGLGNRRGMDRVLTELCTTMRPFGLIHLDLDFFKTVNDTLGHAAGDHVLQVAARTITDWTRAGDTLIRSGGDEFVIILPGLVDVARLRDLTERLIGKLERPIPFGAQSCRISASAGIVVSHGGRAVSPDTWLERADRALYASKKHGRGRATVFSADLPRLSARA